MGGTWTSGTSNEPENASPTPRQLYLLPHDLSGGTEGLPKTLAAMQPKFGYVLLDVRRFDADTLALGLQDSASGVNFALAQFALENAAAEDLLLSMAIENCALWG